MANEIARGIIVSIWNGKSIEYQVDEALVCQTTSGWNAKLKIFKINSGKMNVNWGAR